MIRNWILGHFFLGGWNDFTNHQPEVKAIWGKGPRDEAIFPSATGKDASRQVDHLGGQTHWYHLGLFRR